MNAKARRVIREELAATPVRYRDASVVVEDAAGNFAAYIPKGGFVNATSGLCAYGLIGEDLSRIRGRLRRLGVRGTIVELDAAIYEEQYAFEAREGENPWRESVPAPPIGEGVVAFIPRPLEEGPMTDKTRAQRQRERRRLLGLCSQCPTSKQTPAMPGKTVCEACSAGAQARVAAARAAKRAAKVVSAPGENPVVAAIDKMLERRP